MNVLQENGDGDQVGIIYVLMEPIEDPIRSVGIVSPGLCWVKILPLPVSEPPVAKIQS